MLHKFPHAHSQCQEVSICVCTGRWAFVRVGLCPGGLFSGWAFVRIPTFWIHVLLIFYEQETGWAILSGGLLYGELLSGGLLSGGVPSALKCGDNSPPKQNPPNTSPPDTSPPPNVMRRAVAHLALIACVGILVHNICKLLTMLLHACTSSTCLNQLMHSRNQKLIISIYRQGGLLSASDISGWATVRWATVRWATVRHSEWQNWGHEIIESFKFGHKGHYDTMLRTCQRKPQLYLPSPLHHQC